MKCPTNEKLAAYHAGELPEAEATEVREHLAECPECARRAQGLHQLSGYCERLLATPECLTAEEATEVAEGTATTDLETRARAHSGRCELCRELLGWEATAAVAAQEAAERRARVLRAVGWSAAAAAACLVIVLLVARQQAPSGRDEQPASLTAEQPLVARWREAGGETASFTRQELEELHAALPRDAAVLRALIARLEADKDRPTDPADGARVQRYRTELQALIRAQSGEGE